MPLVIEEIEELPEITRDPTKTKAGLGSLIAALRDGEPHIVRDVMRDDKERVSQRIRYASRKIGMKVKIRQSNMRENVVDLAFQGYN